LELSDSRQGALGTLATPDVVLQPESKLLVERGVLRTRLGPRFFDQPLVGTKSDLLDRDLNTSVVRTNAVLLVYSAMQCIKASMGPR
jgi:hypothetical protein